MKYKHNLYTLLILFCAMFVAQNVGAQVKGNQYVTFNKVAFGNGNNNIQYITSSDALNEDENTVVSKAFDGNNGSYWKSEVSAAPAYLIFDVGDGYQNIKRLQIYVSDSEGYAKSFKLECNSSSDAASSNDWQTIETIEDFTTTGTHILYPIILTGRYVKLTFEKKTEQEQINVNEVSFYTASDNYINKTIQHKVAKWFDLRSGISDAAKAMDTFDDETKMFTLQDGTTEVQAAHTYLDTIYVHKGTSVSLEIPDKLGTNTSIKSYQRWYSFRTDDTYRTNNTGENDVWDLLTPADGISGTSYRYANGYVGYPKGANMYKVNFYVPTDEEFKAWFGEDATKKYDNNFYLVACDVSSYTDYTKNFDRESSSKSSFDKPQSDGNTYEPTLTHRVLFYIVTVDNRDEEPTVTWKKGMGRLKDPAYQGGTLDEGKKYLEEYDISFPFTRVSDHTKELVALSKDAWSYAIPGVSKDEDNNTLEVSLKDENSGITLATTKLTGMTRIIQFNYPHDNTTDNTQYVDANNSKATIYVTKTVGGVTYNIARFNLTFIRDTRLLTQTQLEQIEDGTIQNESLKYYQFRTDKYLEQNYQLLTSLNFDYDPAVADTYGSASFYPFPLAWTSNSYSFYDGANNRDFKNSNKYPEWGFYSIMNDFMEGDHWTNGTKNTYAKPLPGSNYHMYIDASDRPGVIARLPFRRKLCKGSELFVTAWVKSAGWSSSMADAGMLFSIMGVKTDDVLGTVYEPIYRHSSSQVRRTDYLSGKMPGTGSGTNEWMQMYFSFVIDADADYDSYVLQIDNNSASTDGGDMYIDDIRVYIATPSAEVKQLDATCTNERTLMSIKLDWNRLLSRLGQEEGQNKMEAIDFCFIDKAKYDDYLAQNPGQFQQAIEHSVVKVGDNAPDGGYNKEYNTLYFNLDFDLNATYDKPHPRLAGQNVVDGKYCFYGTTDESGNKALAVDFYSDLTPNRTYMMLIQVNDGNEASSSDFQESINNDECGINTSFTVTAQTLLRVNGEVVDPSTDFCAGQIFNFSAQVRVPKQEADGSESYTIVDKGVYFDWFFGTEKEYMQEDPDHRVSLEQALTTFREIYPDNEDLTGVVSGTHTPEGTTEAVELTEEMIKVIEKYLNDSGEAEGAHNRLVLHKENLDITLLNSGLKLVIQPIPMIFPPDGTVDKDSWAKVCWNYVPLEFNVSGDAPQLHAGFNLVQYPSDDFNPCLRIGLDQIAETTADKPLRVNLRGAKYVSEKAAYIGMVTATSAEVYSKIYLIDTDDPAYKSKYFPEGFSEFSLPIGYIKSLHAQEYNDQSDFNDYMEIYFDTETTQSNDFRFQPKEGYYYTFAVHFEEHGEEGSDVSNACFGKFTVKMKVVPEYLVWQGTDVATLNWNNDANWKRADAADIKNTDGTYETNAANTTDNGFVPMLFSNVVMPRGSKAELYMAGYTNADGKQEWDSDRPSHMGLPTENIQYDLMAYDNTSDNTLSTQRYRVNICRDIHFEPDAQMLHAEQLLYNKAWTDVEITPGQWTAVSTPLQDVVAGDWYAPTATGKQETEYFKDITFNDNDYNRLNPAVYQRSWSTGANIVEDGGGTTPVSFATEWSSAYNDASVPYVAGGGFSIQGILNQGLQPSSTDKLLFRFPKADTSYKVSTGTLSRNNAGKLLVSNMVNRSDPYTYVDPVVVTATLTPSIDGKYLMVGNPFMAPLDVQAFVAANSDVLAQKYWISFDLTTTAVTNDGTEWSEGTSLIPPYSVFYVEAKTPSTAGVEVKFTAAMQKFVTSSTDAGSQAASLKITAEAAEGSSSAAVRYAASASNGFGMEDAQMISGLTGNADNAPKVYTVAGNTAVSVNQLKDAQRIPLGVTAADGSVVTLTFSGVAAVKDAALYDAELQSETPLHEGYQLTVNGSSYGRYFLIGKGPGTTTGISDVETVGNVSVSSILPRQIVVTSDAELRSVSVWSVSGALLKKATLNGDYTCTLNNVDSDVVVVRTETANGTQMTKLRVR